MVIAPHYRAGRELPKKLLAGGLHNTVFEVAFTSGDGIGRASSFEYDEESCRLAAQHLANAGLDVTMWRHGLNGRRIYRTAQVFPKRA